MERTPSKVKDETNLPSFLFKPLQMPIRYSLKDKARILKQYMNDGAWYTSEKVRMFDPMNKIEFDISTALSLLYKKGFLDRTESRRLYHNTAKRFHHSKRYMGLYAYKFKGIYLKENHEQLNINYGNCTTEKPGNPGQAKA